MFRAALLLFALASFPLTNFAQAVDETLRVTVSMNPDGSKTVYETNPAGHRQTATTTNADGKLREKIIYRLDAAARYESGEVFAPNGKLRFRTRYEYNPAGQLAEETQSTKDGSVLHRIVYSFDPQGRANGYSVYDGAGKLLGRTTPKRKQESR